MGRLEAVLTNSQIKLLEQTVQLLTANRCSTVPTACLSLEHEGQRTVNIYTVDKKLQMH